MAKFTVDQAVNIRLPGGFEVSGAANATHRIPDSLVEEFLRDQVPLIHGSVAWITQDEMTSAATPASIVTAGITATTISASTSVQTPAAYFKGKPWYDPRAYGAVGDGVTDDLAAFNLTVAAIPAAGGRIYIPDGSYKLSNSWDIDRDSIHVELSENATVFTTTPTSQGHTIGFVGVSTAASTATSPQRAWASIRGGIVYNSDTTQADNAIGFVRYANVRCENVRITQCGRKAITAQYGVDNVAFIDNSIGTARYDAITVESTCNFVAIIGNSIASAGALGINCNTAVTDVHIERNTIGATGGNAINVGTPTRAWVIDNTIKSAVGDGIYASAGAVVLIRGNHISGMTQYGIELSTISSRLVISENYIDSTGMSASGSFDAIVLTTCVRPSIIGNKVTGTKHRYGINALDASGNEPISYANIVATAVSGLYGGALPKLAGDIHGSTVSQIGDGPSGTAFPSSPATNDRFFRTDRGLRYYYDGTRWLTVELYRQSIPIGDSVLPIAATANLARGAIPDNAYDLWLVDIVFTTRVMTTSNTANFWTVDSYKTNAGGTATSIATFSTAADTAGNWAQHAVSIGSLCGQTNFMFEIVGTKTAAPGTLYAMSVISYRLVG